MNRVYTMSNADQDALLQKIREKRRELINILPKEIPGSVIDILEQYDPTILTNVQQIEYVPNNLEQEKKMKRMRSLPTNQKPRAKKENRVFRLTAAK